jgi:hypothetical protein
MGSPSTPSEVSVKATLICAAAAFFLTPAFAAEGDAKPTQQSKFSACAHESKGLRGDEHQKFMSDCLKGHAPEEDAAKKDTVQKTSAEAGSQQSRMKTCNDEARARDVHGDERRAFMSSCLKG